MRTSAEASDLDCIGLQQMHALMAFITAFGCAGDLPLPVPFTCFWGVRDKRISQQMVLGWQKFTSSNFACREISGHHLWPLDKEAKLVWLTTIADGLSDLVL